MIEHLINAKTTIYQSLHRGFHAAKAQLLIFIQEANQKRQAIINTFGWLRQNQNRIIINLLHDYGPSVRAASRYPELNFWTKLLFYTAAVPLVSIALLLQNMAMSMRFAFDYYLVLLDLKNEFPSTADKNPRLLASILFVVFNALTFSILLAPSLVMLIAENVAFLIVGFINGLFNHQHDTWSRPRLQRNVIVLYTLGLTVGDGLYSLFQGLSEGFSRIRALAYQNTQQEFTTPRSPSSWLGYGLGLVSSAAVGLISLLIWDNLLLAGYLIVSNALQNGYHVIFRQTRSTMPNLKPWQQVNLAWLLYPVVLLATSIISLSARLMIESSYGLYAGLLKGYHNTALDLAYAKVSTSTHMFNTVREQFFSYWQQSIEKTIHIVISLVLHAFIINTYKHLGQGAIHGFNHLLPSQQIPLELTRDLSGLQRYNYPIRIIASSLGWLTSITLLIPIRLIVSLSKGLSFGIINGVIGALYLNAETVKTEASVHLIDRVFANMAYVLETITAICLDQIISKMLIEGVVINTSKCMMTGMQHAYYAIFPAQPHTLLFEWPAPSNLQFLTYVLGYPLGIISFSVSISTLAIARFSYQLLLGVNLGLMDGLKLGLAMPSGQQDVAHTPDEAVDRIFQRVEQYSAQLITPVGMIMGGLGYNLLSIIDGITYPSRMIYRDNALHNISMQILKTELLPRGYPGFLLGIIAGTVPAVGVVTYRLIGNGSISFYMALSHSIATAFEVGGNWHQAFMIEDQREAYSQKFGIIGKILGQVIGMPVAALIFFCLHAPSYIASGYLLGLNKWINRHQLEDECPHWARPVHSIARVFGNISGLIYSNMLGMGWLIGECYAVAYVDKNLDNPVNFENKNVYQKIPGRALAFLCYLPAMALIFSSITVYRFIEQNGLNLVDSCIRGFKIDSFLNTKLNTYEQVLSFPSSMLGFVLGFSARMMVDGIKQLSLLPAIIAHHAQLGFKRGLSPFIDPQPVTNASMQHVYRAAWPVTFMGMIVGAIIGIIRNAGLAIRANFFKAIEWAFFDNNDELLKSADDFHTKSLLRRIAGQIAGLPIHLLLMPLMLIGITSLRLIASSLAALVLNANEAYTLSRPKLMDDLTTWEHILSIPGVILGYALGGVVRALQYLTYDLLYSLMEGLFDGFKYLNDIYPSDASHQVRQGKTLRPANVIRIAPETTSYS